MPDLNQVNRKQFLALAGAGLPWALTARAADVGGEPPVSLDDAHKGTLEIDLRIMNQFGVQPREVQDFYAACRGALTGDNPEREVADICRTYHRWKLGGPMLGDIKTTGVAVWMHLPEPEVVRVVITPEGGGVAKTYHSAEAGRMPSVRCDGLSPDAAYAYAVTDSKNRNLGGGRFVTPPVALSDKPLRIAFGGDFHKIGMYRPELMKLVRERAHPLRAGACCCTGYAILPGE